MENEAADSESPSPGGGPDVPNVPPDMILFPRRMLYVQAVLFVVVGAAALVVGYAIGRATRADRPRPVKEKQVADRVPIEGRVLYDQGGGRPAGDEGALVIAVPAGKYPADRLSVYGIGPADPPPPQGHRAVQAIRELGGAYARADVSGDFSLFAPEPGQYGILVVSRHAKRPGGLATEPDLAEIAKYFEHADRLVEDFQFRWTAADVHLDAGPIDVTFGGTE